MGAWSNNGRPATGDGRFEDADRRGIVPTDGGDDGRLARALPKALIVCAIGGALSATSTAVLAPALVAYGLALSAACGGMRGLVPGAALVAAAAAAVSIPLGMASLASAVITGLSGLVVAGAFWAGRLTTGGSILAVAAISAAHLGADAVLSWLIDLFLGIPHILLVMLISLACGRGFLGVVAGVSLSHWPSLARLVREEVLQLRQAPYLLAAEKLGVPRGQLVRRHLLPHLLPQFLTGLILQFPHAILHEASVTFLGFGLSSEQPAIGVILSESMQYLTTGRWWLALFPGAALVGVVLLFAGLGEQVRRLLDPSSVHQ